MCDACNADLEALGRELAGVIVVEAEACAQRIQLRARIERILDGEHSDETAPVDVAQSRPVLNPPV